MLITLNMCKETHLQFPEDVKRAESSQTLTTATVTETPECAPLFCPSAVLINLVVLIKPPIYTYIYMDR